MNANANSLKTPGCRFVLQEEAISYVANPICIDMPEKVEAYFNSVIKNDFTFEPNKEHVWVVAVDTRLNVIGYNVISVGTVNESSAHVREIFRPVIAAGAYGFTMIHNHPSGDPAPSRADELVTRRLVEAARIMQLTFLDHIIMGKPAPGRMPYYSFREAGIIP